VQGGQKARPAASARGLRDLIKGAQSHSELLRFTLAVCIVLTELLFLYFMSGYGIEYALSSACVTLALLFQLRYGMRQDSVIPADVVTFIFSWLFLDLSPKIQLIGMPGMLVNTSSVIPSRVQMTNLLCALFIVVFTVVYAWLNRRPRGAVRAAAAGSSAETDPLPRSFAPFGVSIAVASCLIVVALLGSTPYSTDTVASIAPSAMVTKKFLLFMPSATLLIFVHQMRRSGQRWRLGQWCALVLLVMMVAITENPLTEKRNALGPVYLGLIFVMFEAHLRSLNRRLLVLVASMVLVFPAITVLTHSHRQFLHGVKLAAILDTLKDHYLSVNYDAWANLYTIVEMVQSKGIYWGRQLLGDVLFFVPSAVWHGKPMATGIAVGDFLIMHHSGWFTNLSAPLVGEAYIDFGSVGVALYGAAFAILVTKLNRFADRSGSWAAFPFGIYFSLFLLFALRGSLMIAFAYGTGSVLAFASASWLLSSGRRRIGQRYFRPGAASLAAARPIS
jgi:hypothetical protein